MGEFNLRRKAGVPNTFLLTYNGQVVQRQKNDLGWVPFETTDAYFNNSEFWVLNNSDQSVKAKFLTYNGNFVTNTSGNPYIVPYDFNFEQFIEDHKNVNKADLVAFRRGGKDDLQTSYNGAIDGPFCPSFTAAASFLYGVASNQAGLSVDASIMAGGAYNYASGNPTGGEYGNNVNNPPNIRSGYDFMDNIKQHSLNTNDHIDGQYAMNQTSGQPRVGGDAEDPKVWAEREKAIREHIPSKNNGDATEEYYKQAKSLLVKEGGWSQNLDTAIAQTMLKQKYEEKQIMDAMKSISPCVPALDERAQSYANYTMGKARGSQDTKSAEITVNPTKIGDLRKTLNGQMDEIIKQQKDLSQQRDQVDGAPLTKEQAEKLAASNHLNGADKELDKQAQELQAKKDKLSQYEKDTIAFGKEHGLDKTLWRHAPEIFKGEGLKDYESSMAAIEHNKQVFDKQATEIQAKRDQLEARLQTPEAKSEIAKKSEEILVQDKERLAKLEGLDQKINELTNEKHDIMRLRDVIPSRKLDREIDVQGDSKNVQNLLSQTDQLKQQATEMQQAQAQSCGQSM